MKKKYHLIGIGGIGMSALARVLIEKGESVSGSDLSDSALLSDLRKLGVNAFVGHAAEHVTSSMTVIFNTDIKPENPEYKAAAQLGCSLLHRSDLLAQLMSEKKALAITGCHGKTTTTALLASVLHEAGYDPSFAVGGILPQFHANGKHGAGPYFVAEADESDGSFLKYFPEGAIVTNIDFDHLSFFKTKQRQIDAYQTFLKQVRDPNLLLWCGDDPHLQALHPKGVAYGFNDGNPAQCSHFRQEGWHSYFDLSFQGKSYCDIELALLGKHNALNATAVFAQARLLGAPEKNIRKALREFKGVGRRCEKKGEVDSILFLDDYGHHPVEIKATLEGIRKAIGNRRLIAVYQPHRYTRTQECAGMYPQVFDPANVVILTDIYSAGESPIPGVTVDQLMSEVQSSQHLSCAHIPRHLIAAELAQRTLPGDVVVTLGAGNITHAGPETINLIKK